MRSRAVPFVILVAGAIALFFLLRPNDDTNSHDDVGERPAEQGEDEAKLLGRGAPGKDKKVVPTTAKDSGKQAAKKAAPRASPKKPARSHVGRLAEAAGDGKRATLRVRVVDQDGHPRDGAHLELYGVEKGVGRKTFDEPLGADGEITVEDLSPGPRAIFIRIGSLQRMASVELVAGRVTEAVVPFPLGATVSGVVRHLAKGPLAQVMVRLKRSDDRFKDSVYASTDKEGRYRLEDIVPGTYAVSLTGESIGYSPRPRAELVVHTGAAMEQDFVLGQLTLQGRVREAGSRRALSGVRVALQGGLYASTATNAQGDYAFEDVPSGEYTLAVGKDGYGFRFAKTGPVVAGAVSTVDIELSPAAVIEIEVVDQAGAPITGEVILGISPIDPPDGTSLSTNRRTDAEGRIRYAQIVPGRYTFSVSARGYGRTRKEVLVNAGTTSTRFEIERTAPLESVSLTGIVRDAVTRRPIAGAQLVVQSPRRMMTTSDKEGRYRLRGLGGHCMLHVGKDGYGIRFFRGVEAGKEAKLDIDLTPAAVLHLRLTKESGDPVVGGITLAITPKRGTEGTNLGTGVNADENGNATYRQIVPGQYTISVSQEGAGRASTETEVREGTNTLDLRLR